MSKETFKNPILPGFHPDPSICRVGEDYYLINSSFCFFPGLPIFHSKDLVNWNQIGYALNRMSQLNLDGAFYTGGIFAPTIRYNKGTFYIITTNVDNGGNFIITAKDPSGPWSEPYWLETPGIDPSIFFDDDGKVYYIGTREVKEQTYFGEQEIWIQQLDLNSMKLIGGSYALWKGALNKAYFPEGPHIYKVDGYYYLMIAEGGTEHYHSVTIARSKDILGEYEGNPGNPILTHRHLGKDYPISNVGHADLVQTQNGDWYAVLLASRPYGGYYKNLTRETFLIPVKWEDGWSIMSPGTGRVEFEYEKPNLPYFEVIKNPIRDDFNENELNYIWNSIRTPREEFFSLTERKSYLRIKVRPQTLLNELKLPPIDENERYNIKDFVVDNPSFIGRRLQHMNFVCATKMEFNPSNEYESAGIALIQNNNHQFRFEYTIKDAKKIIRLTRFTADVKSNYFKREFSYKNVEDILAEVEFESRTIYLKIIANGQNYSFYYGKNEENMELLMENVDARILSPEIAGGCSGTYLGLFASSNGFSSNNIVDFDWFDYEGK